MRKLFLLSTAGVVLMLFLVLQWAGIRDVAAAFLSINPLFILLIVLMQFAMMLVYAMRYRLLLRSAGVNAGIRAVIVNAFFGAAMNNLTPVIRFGGEPFKGYMMAKDASVKKQLAFAAIATDSFITGLSLLVLVYFGFVALLVFNILNLYAVALILALMFVPVIAGVYLLYDKRALAAFSKRASGLIGRFSPKYGKQLPRILLSFRSSMGLSMRRKDVLAAAFMLALVERFIEVLSMFVIFVSLGIKVDLYVSAMVLGVGMLAGLLPLLPGGLVAFESSTILLLRLFNIRPALAAISILLWRGVNYWMITVVGMAIGWYHGMGLNQKKGRGNPPDK